MSYWSRSFPGLAECLAEVRQFTRMVIGDAPGSDMVVLAVSELAGNAIVHTASGAPGGQFVVHLATFADRWQIRVDDEGAACDPHIVVGGIADVGDLSGLGDLGGDDGDSEDGDGDFDWGAEAGRGLAMVASFSEKWGVIGDCRARAVWAQIPNPVVRGDRAESAASNDILQQLEAAAEAMEAQAALDQEPEEKPGDEAFGPGTEPEAVGRPAAAGVADSGAQQSFGWCEGPWVAEVVEPAAPLAPLAPLAPVTVPEQPILPIDWPIGVVAKGAVAHNPAPAMLSQWPGRVRSDPKVAERHRRAARGAVFMRALIENAYVETVGPVKLPYWPPFPNPRARRGARPVSTEHEAG